MCHRSLGILQQRWFSVASATPGPGLIGRRSECEVLDQLLTDMRAHKSRVLVLRGEAGVGKTALMDYVESASTDCRVVRAAGVESEMELAFAGVHQLCAPMLHLIDDLPTPQRDALGTAFGLMRGDAADRFLVGLAVLSLLSAAADDQPLVCLVDDAQWLDQISTQVLVFAARRLLAEPVAFVFAVRDPSVALEVDGLPSRTVGGLSHNDAHALLDAVSAGRLDEQVRERIVAETRGNPLALLELPRTVPAGELAGGFALPDTRPLSSHIEQSFVRRIESLPPETQRLLLLAAAEPLGDGSLLERAAERLAIGSDAREPAEDDGLIEFGAHVRFRHPLVRAAAYRAGSVIDRRAAHAALADVTDPEVDPDRRAWHRAHAASRPDEAVAAELELSAGRAQSRGGAAAAAAFLERAVELTPDPGRRAKRSLAAAQFKFDAGAFDEADALLAAAELGSLDELQQANLALRRAEIAYARRRGSEAPALLLDAAKGLDAVDDELARETFLEALGAAIYAGRYSDRPLEEIAHIVREAPASASGAQLIDLLLDGVAARFTDGYAASVSPLRRALEAFQSHARQGGRGGTRWFPLAWLLAADLWEDQLLEDLATRAVQLARQRGALADLPIALTYRAHAHINAGEFAAAAALYAESASLTLSIGTTPLRASALLLPAWRGDEANMARLYDLVHPQALERGEGRVIGGLAWISALLNNGLGRYDEALVQVPVVLDFDDLAARGYALAEFVEAAARRSAHDIATEAMRELEERTLASGTDWALGIRARSQALLLDGEAAEALYLEAIERLGRTRVAVHLARAHLLYGEWLRRENRRVDAREHLRRAYEMLHEFGADSFAERAHRELLATGETARERTVTAGVELTPQETQVASLAAAGRTNAEIGGELFISPRTVEYHLGKVFTKLEITSRRELRTVFRRLDR